MVAAGKEANYDATGGPVTAKVIQAGSKAAGIVKRGLLNAPKPQQRISGKSHGGQSAVPPIVATEARPGEGLNDPLFNLPVGEQAKLRTDVVKNSQGRAQSGQFQFYNDLGIPHSVIESDGSFRGEVTPNYLHVINNGSMEDARFVATIEGLLNLQHAEAIMKPDPRATEGVAGALFERTDGQPMTGEDTQTVYDALNGGHPPDRHIDITRIPGHGIFAGNFLDDLSDGGFFDRVANAREDLGGRYTANTVRSDGDFVQRGKNDGIQEATNDGYTSRLRESRHPGVTARSSDLSSRIDRDLIEPRVKAYRDAAIRNGIDPDIVEAQIRDAGERLKRSLLGVPPGETTQYSPIRPPGPPANAGGSSDSQPTDKNTSTGNDKTQVSSIYPNASPGFREAMLDPQNVSHLVAKNGQLIFPNRARPSYDNQGRPIDPNKIAQVVDVVGQPKWDSGRTLA